MKTAGVALPKLHISNSNNMDVGTALRDTLICAKKTDRVICGIYESGQKLERDPDNVMLCILPNNDTNDVTLHIHYTLIEAFCWENEIRLIKVDSAEKLAKLLGEKKPSRPLNDNDIASGRITRNSTADFNCILVEYPSEDLVEAEEDVVEFHKMTCHLNPQPIVKLAEAV